MTKGAKIALGCGCLFLLVVGAIVALLGFGAFWAKSKLEEVTRRPRRSSARRRSRSRIWSRR